MKAMTKIKLFAASKALSAANVKVKEIKRSDWYLQHKLKKKAIRKRRLKRAGSILGALSVATSSYLVYIHRYSLKDKAVKKIEEIRGNKED